MDDSPEDLFTHARFLRRHGAAGELIGAQTGADGLEQARRATPDCILLDFHLPDMDALEFLSELRGDATVLPYPVVILTGTGTDEPAVEAMRAGAEDYLMKDEVTAESLRRALRNAMERWRIRRDLEGERRREQAARAAVERGRRRLELLAEAGRVLGASLDLRTTLDGVADAVVPRLADLCALEVPAADGQRVGAVRGTPPPGLAPPVLAPAPAAPVLLHDGPAGSTLVVPLGATGRAAGALALAVGPHGPPLDADDVRVAEDLARRLALHLETVHRYEVNRLIAATLQQALLPDRLPTGLGVELARRYLPGAAGVDVGGDWYDAWPLPDGRVGIAVGDVVGRGVAAAARMGRLRTALWAYAVAGAGPAEALTATGRLLEAFGPEALATAVALALDPADGRFTFANAGHPPPLLLTASGEARFLAQPHGAALGALGGEAYEVGRGRLDPGDRILLYTDGLVERRDATLDAGLARLAAAAASAPPGLEALCDHVMAALLGDAPTGDDVALLAARRPGAAPTDVPA